MVVVPHVYEAYKGRYLGWELRDTFLGSWGTLYAFLFRIPLQESTVATQVLKTGTGGLWIDGCRVKNESGEHFRGESVTKQTTVSGDLRTGAALGMYGAGASFEPTNHPGGRWPPNLLLVHHPECVQDGTKKVKPGNGSGRAHGVNASANNLYGGSWTGRVLNGECILLVMPLIEPPMLCTVPRALRGVPVVCHQDMGTPEALPASTRNSGASRNAWIGWIG